jgi:hypothetical protein
MNDPTDFNETRMKRILCKIKYFDEKRLAIKSPSSQFTANPARGNIFQPVALIAPTREKTGR